MYHSALKSEAPIKGSLDSYANARGLVFVHDLNWGVHPQFREADAIYTEPAWRDGYAKFLARADRAGSSSFSDYLTAIRNVIVDLRIPAFVIAGKHMLAALRPEATVPVVIHGYGAYAALWHAPLPPAELTIDALCAWVCERYETILDFSCGYGNTARHARRFICTDINARCVYYVAKELMGYDG